MSLVIGILFPFHHSGKEILFLVSSGMWWQSGKLVGLGVFLVYEYTVKALGWLHPYGVYAVATKDEMRERRTGSKRWDY